jgi:cysteinyl-tRNA synthetase
VHYRRHLDFTFEALDAACKELARLDTLVRNLRLVRAEGDPHKDVDDAVEEADHDFFAALRDDLKVPQAKACLFDLGKTLNTRLNRGMLARRDAELALDFLYRADRVFSVLDFAAAPALDERVEQLLAERARAREARDWAKADALRAELTALGVTVEDTIRGSRVKRTR